MGQAAEQMTSPIDDGLMMMNSNFQSCPCGLFIEGPHLASDGRVRLHQVDKPSSRYNSCTPYEKVI